MNDITLINDAIKKHRELLEYYDAMGCKDDVLVQERYIGWLSELREYKEQEKTCEDQAKFHPVDEFKCSACGIHLAEWVCKETDEKIIEAAHKCLGEHFVCTECPLIEESCHRIFASYILKLLDKSADNARSNARACERSVNGET